MINLVIADDDIKVRRGLSQLINWESIGAKVVLTAKNGKEVADRLEHLEVDIVISDIRMPLMDGLELARFIKEKSLDVTVILLSGYAEFKYAQEAINQGVRQYILKPMNREKMNKLAKMVSDIVNEKELRAQLLRKIHSAGFRQYVFDILRSGDVSAVQNLIVLDFEKMENLPDVLRDFYLFLLSVLYEFANQIEATEILPHNYTEELIKLADKSAYVKYVEKLFLEVLNFYKKTNGSVISSVKSYIKISYDKENLATASISEHFGLSASYLSSLFKSETGVSITQYITNCRMENAARLLSTTNLPIQTISRKVGYPNVPYFNKVFKGCYDMSPATYRTSGGRKI